MKTNDQGNSNQRIFQNNNDKKLSDYENLDFFRILDVLIDPICIVNEKLKVVYTNKSFDLWHREEDKSNQSVDQSLVKICPLLTEEMIEEYYKIFQNGKPIINNEIYNPKDSNYYSMDRIPLFSQDKQFPISILTIYRKITYFRETYNALKASEENYKGMVEALKDSEEKFRRLITTMGEGVWVADLDLNTIFINPALVKILGYTERELMATKLIEFMIPESQSKFTSVIQQQREDNFSPITYEIIFKHRKHNLLITKVVGSVLTDSKDRILGFFGVISDITKERQYQELQERFIATTSHELRTPLTVIKGYLELLQNGEYSPQEDLSMIIQVMWRNSQRLERLVNAVHDLSTIRAKIFSISPKELILENFIVELESHLRVLFPHRVFIINKHLHDDEWKVYFDDDRIKQVIENLIDNADKHSPPDAIINIFISSTEEGTVFSVQDYGVGISNKNLFQLFQPFSTIPSKYSQKGTGLGLYIIREIVNAHNGSVDVSSKEGEGTIFSVTIPNYVKK